MATEGGHTDVVKLLISCGASPLDENKVALFPFGKEVISENVQLGMTPVHIAARHGHSSVITEFVKQGISLRNLSRKTGMTVILTALNGHSTMDLSVYNLDKNVDRFSPILISISKALHVAAFYGEEDIVRELMR